MLTSNYRPISILSYISKLIEKLMFKRLYKFLEKFDILYDLQFGFRKGYSTKLALIDILEKIKESLDAGSLTFGIYVDLTRDFRHSKS